LRQTPSTLDLETAAKVLKVLTARGLSRFTASEYKVAGLARVGDRADDVLRFLGACGLLDQTDQGWGLSEDGSEVLASLLRGEWDKYARILIGSGFYDDELACIVEAASEVNATLRCPLSSLPQLAPLVGRVLAWDGSLREGSDLVVPLTLAEELLIESGMEQANGPPDWVLERDTVGWRAEQYSMRHERTAHGAKQVRHISRDAGDGFGYDIEVAGPRAARLVEVKGSRSSRISFFITRREFEVAGANAETYELHFWGGIDLGRPPQEEYAALRDLAFPIVVSNVADEIRGDSWKMEPQSWRVQWRG
jgi:hypothetical protein